MRRSPGEPDFLDMRDAILATDAQLQGGGDRTLIRQVFAARGMGGCAASDGGFDTTPDRELQRHRLRVQRRPVGAAPVPAPGRRHGRRHAAALLSDIGFGGFPGRRTSLRRVLRRGLAGRVSCDADCSFRAEPGAAAALGAQGALPGPERGGLARALQRRRRRLGPAHPLPLQAQRGAASCAG